MYASPNMYIGIFVFAHKSTSLQSAWRTTANHCFIRGEQQNADLWTIARSLTKHAQQTTQIQQSFCSHFWSHKINIKSNYVGEWKWKKYTSRHVVNVGWRWWMTTATNFIAVECVAEYEDSSTRNLLFNCFTFFRDSTISILWTMEINAMAQWTMWHGRNIFNNLLSPPLGMKINFVLGVHRRAITIMLYSYNYFFFLQRSMKHKILKLVIEAFAWGRVEGIAAFGSIFNPLAFLMRMPIITFFLVGVRWNVELHQTIFQYSWNELWCGGWMNMKLLVVDHQAVVVIWTIFDTVTRKCIVDLIEYVLCMNQRLCVCVYCTRIHIGYVQYFRMEFILFRPGVICNNNQGNSPMRMQFNISTFNTVSNECAS